MISILKKIFKNKNKLYYFGGRHNKNAGDIYNKNLMEYFNIPYTRKRKMEQANLLCVGSNLDKIVNNSKIGKQTITIIGTGFIQKETEIEKVQNKLNILALRGKLSKKRMEKILNIDLSDCILADAGLLVSKIYPQKMIKNYKLGIIPHYYDKELLDLSKINIDKNCYKIIDIQQDVEQVVKDICECECILSSSLHGLIFSDSYNIPNRQLIISDKITGGCYKFEDYYSAFDMELPLNIDLRADEINEASIHNIIETYLPKDIKTKQHELENVFMLFKNKYQ